MYNIKKIYQYAGKCDDQQNLKDILYAATVSTPKESTDDSPSFPITKTTVKKLSAKKPLCLFTNIFEVKKKTEKRRVGAAQFKRRAIKICNILWYNKNEKGIQKSMIISNVICMHG